MPVIYKFHDIWWFSITPSVGKDIPLFNTDFIYSDNYGISPPIYHIIANKKLYILFEQPMPNNQYKKVYLYIANEKVNKVMNKDRDVIRPVEVNRGGVMLWKNNSHRESKQKIENVLRTMPKEYQMPDDIKNLFIQKYVK
nr:hypothetical protein [Abalone asfa-like virus]